MSYKERTEPLSHEEKKKLKRIFWILPFFIAFIGGVFYLMFSSVKEIDVFFYVLTAFALFFLLIIFLIVKGYVQDLIGGEKQVITGIISDKTVKRNKSRRSKGNNHPNYYLTFGDKELKVDVRIYNQVQVNDFVEYHYGKHSKHSLSIEVLKENEAVSEAIHEGIEKLKPKQDIPLTQKDISLLRKEGFRNLWFNIVSMLVLIWITSAPIFFGLTWLAVIPVLIVWFFVRKILRRYQNAKKDIEYGYKDAKVVKVDDRFTRKRGTISTFYVRFDGKHLAVSEEVYNTAFAGKEMLLYYTPLSRTLLGLN